MSGLAVLVGPGAGSDAVRRMLAAAAHRGPAGPVHEADGMALGVQALPLAPAFTAPALAVDGGTAAAVAGCLFSGRAIVAGAHAAEALLAAWRAGRLDDLRGAFAGVIVADGGRRVAAVRSQTGERPLFWRALPDGGYAFASEVKQVKALEPAPMHADPQVLLDHIAIDFSDTAATPWPGINRVPAASRLGIDGAGITAARTWQARPLVGTAHIAPAEASARFRELLGQAIARRLDPGTCVLMSGGIDSTAIAAEAIRVNGGPVPAVSALFTEHASADETEQIRATVAALGLEGHEVHPRPRPFRRLDDELALHDAPSVVAVPENLVALLDAAAAAGCTSALDGNDGDSLFGPAGGLERALLKRRELRSLGRLVAASHADGASRARAVRARLVWPFLPQRVRRAYARARGCGMDASLPAWVTGPLRSRFLARHDPERPPDWFGEQAAIYGGMLEVLLEVLERIALSRSVTLLHPLADIDLVEFFLTLPPEVKFVGGRPKGLVRQSFPELPEIVSGRSYKPHFDDVSSAGAEPADLRAALAAGPRELPGVNWDTLGARAGNGGMPGSEVAMLVRTLQADHLLARR